CRAESSFLRILPPHFLRRLVRFLGLFVIASAAMGAVFLLAITGSSARAPAARRRAWGPAAARGVLWPPCSLLGTRRVVDRAVARKPRAGAGRTDGIAAASRIRAQGPGGSREDGVAGRTGGGGRTRDQYAGGDYRQRRVLPAGPHQRHAGAGGWRRADTGGAGALPVGRRAIRPAAVVQRQPRGGAGTELKQMAVDQTSEKRRSFDLGDYIRETVVSLDPRLRDTHVALRRIDRPAGIAMTGYPARSPRSSPT
ncbi:hypothetical protein ACU4GD_06435, partial [Cupriavidus basilensis]